MWELPSHVLPDSNNSTAGLRERMAREFVTGLFNRENDSVAADMQPLDLESVGELDSVPWVFSHLKLTMHVHLFQVHNQQEVPLADDDPRPRRWAAAEAVEAETMGTGMRQCWKIVAGAA